MKSILSLLLLFFLHSPGLGLAAPAEPSEFWTKLKLIESNPLLAYQWAKTQQELGPANPYSWCLSIMVILRTNSLVSSNYLTAEKQEQALRLAEQEGFWDIKAVILAYQMYKVAGDLSGIEEALRLVERKGMLRLKARLLLPYSAMLMNQNKVDLAIEAVNESLKILENTPDAEDLDHMIARVEMAVILESQKQPDKAMDIYQLVDHFCVGANMPFFCATNAFNQGVALVHQEGREFYKKAIQSFQKALNFAENSGVKRQIGTASLGLSSSYYKLEDYPNAYGMAERSVQVFETLDDVVWLGDAHKKWAESATKLKKYARALQSIEKARSLYPASFTPDFYQLAVLEKKIYQEQGLYEKAFQASELEWEFYRKQERERADSNSEKKLADLALKAEEEKSKRLETEVSLREAKLKEQNYWRIALLVFSGLSLVLMGVSALAYYRARQARIERARLKLVLATIDEGVLIFNHQLLIQPGYSQFLNELLAVEGDLSQQSIIDLVFRRCFLSEDDLAKMQAVLFASFHESKLNWEFNCGNLPDVIILHDRKDRRLALRWIPSVDRADLVQRVLLVIQDVTDIDQLHRQLQLAETQVDSVKERWLSLAFIDHQQVIAYLERLLRLLSLLQSQRLGEAEWRRDLHTAKGNARAFGLKLLSERIHSLETEGHNEQKDTLAGLWQECEEHMRIAQLLSAKAKKSAKSHFSLSEIFNNQRWEMAAYLQHHGLTLKGVTIYESVHNLDATLAELLQNFLVHALNNATDHGYVIAKKRGRDLQEVSFDLSLREEKGCYQLLVRDYGVGINWEALAARAKSLGQKAETKADLLELIFADGVSTAESLTQTSGRGVGMAAIRSLARSLRGEAILSEAASGPGSQLEIHFYHPDSSTDLRQHLG